jgi:hypothetical protein
MSRIDALSSVTRERLVPLLVERLLLEQGIELRTLHQAAVPEKDQFQTNR